MTLALPGNGKKYYQGIYRPKYPDKYAGKEYPRYLSNYELRFFRWCDLNENVKSWASEAVIIPYLNPLDNRMHKYYTDGVVALKEGDRVQKYLIEIKPKSQTVAPVAGKKRSKTLLYESKQWVQNQAKWAAAKVWAERNGYKFLILTQEHLGIK